MKLAINYSINMKINQNMLIETSQKVLLLENKKV